jgi:hypothetical protein
MQVSHPEIETGTIFAELQLMHDRDDLLSLTTSIDLLEVYRQPKPRAKWNKNLQHDALLQHINKASL